MKKLWPYLFIFLTVLIFFRPFILKGFLPIPSDTIVGLYHPFRDGLAAQYPRGFPYKNFLITDPVRQEYPWKNLTVEMEKKLQFPLWNPYSFSGYPLLANFQSAVFYPLNMLFFVFPFQFSWGIFIFLQPLFAGIFLYMYLRNCKLSISASSLGAITFMFCGFSVVWLEWGNVVSTLLWVPLILLAIDHLVISWQKKWVIIFAISEIMSFLAGHLQVWFYCLLITNAYLFLRLYENTKNTTTKHFLNEFLKRYFPFALVGLGIVIITVTQWVPTVAFIALSARGVDQNYLITPGWFLPWQHLIQFVAPDFFGNPATLNYFGVWNYAEFVGYIGIIPLIFALYALFFRRDKITLFFSTTLVLSLLFVLPTFLATIPFQLHIPFLSTSQPTRLMAIIDLALCILMAYGFDEFLRTKSKRIIIPLGVTGACIGILWVVVIDHMGLSVTNEHVARQNLFLPTLLLILGIVLLTGLLLNKKRIPQNLLVCMILVIVLFDLLRFANKFIPFTSPIYLFPHDKVLSFLQRNIGNNRFMTTDSRIMPSNFADMYKLQSVDGYDPLYLKNYAEFISASERNLPNISSPFGFNRIIEPHRYDSRLIDLLGVKYVLSLTDLVAPTLHKVYAEGQTQVYENTRVLARTFFVGHTIQVHTSQEAINQLFIHKDILQSSAIVTGMLPKENWSVGKSDIISYDTNEIHIKTQTMGDGFLVLTDIFYPTWHAYIDGKETKIYQTDFAMRGIIIPAGDHLITFSDRIF